jgi:hypothetical protein
MHKVIQSETRADQNLSASWRQTDQSNHCPERPRIFCEDEIEAAVVGKALRTGNASPPFLSIQLSEATEADLLAAKSARPDQAHRVDGWIKFLKQNAEPPPPIQVQFLNAAELQKDTILRIHRDESGKLEYATAHRI